jgi:hypothetical protein
VASRPTDRGAAPSWRKGPSKSSVGIDANHACAGTMRRWVSALLATAAAACGGQVDGGANRDASGPDATALGSIAGGAIGESCSTDSQCPTPLSCRGGTCQDAPSNGTGASCAVVGDCPSGLCLYGQCKTLCQSASDCVSGWTCPSNHLCDCSPSPEVCDGQDNDCDGIVDDEPAVGQACELQTPGDVCVNGHCTCKTTCGGPRCIDLTSDAKNCGSCGTICGGTCTFGRCVITLAPAPSGTQSGFTPEYIALDGASVYWTTCDDTQARGSIMKVAIGGGSPVVLAPNEACPAGIAVNATSVYWIISRHGQLRCRRRYRSQWQCAESGAGRRPDHDPGLGPVPVRSRRRLRERLLD